MLIFWKRLFDDIFIFIYRNIEMLKNFNEDL